MNKRFFRLLFGTIALCMALSACGKNQDNIFDENELIITDDEIKEINDSLEEELGMTISEDDDKYLILSSVMKNDNLTDEEKKMFYNLFYVIEDNDKYLNKEELYENWIDIDIKYPDKNEDESLSGMYNPGDNYISIFSNSDEKTKNHEGIHSIFSYSSKAKCYSRALCEGVTELINREYCCSEPFVADNTYIYEMAYVKMLYEIVGKDKVLEAYLENDLTIISKAMSENYGTEEDALNVLYVLEDSLDRHIEMEAGGSVTLNYTLEEIKSAFIKLDEYYINNSKDLENVEAYAYNRALFVNLYTGRAYEGYLDFVEQNGLLEKVYLSSELESECPDTKIVDYNDRMTVEVKEFVK